MKKTNKKNRVDLIAKGSQQVAKQVEEDLLIDDPDPQKASGIINKSMKGLNFGPRQSNKNSLSDNREDSQAEKK